eukprot:7094264-Alexandrium_andersonii.AAC.1
MADCGLRRIAAPASIGRTADCILGALLCKDASQMRHAVVAHAEPRCPDDGHKSPRTDASSNDGLAIIVAG